MTPGPVTPGRLFKVQGAGNDFLLGIGGWAETLADDPAAVERLCRRRFGLGADGALAVTPQGQGRIRLVYRNADGTQEPFCGNGTRCAALAAVELLGMQSPLVVVTDWCEVPVVVAGTTVTLGLPEAIIHSPPIRLESPLGVFMGVRAEVGVPHVLIAVEDPAALDLATIGPSLRHDPQLGPGGGNISLLGPFRSGVADIRTWERGVEAETLCCGSAVVSAGAVRIAENGARVARLRARSGDVLEVHRVTGGLELVGPAELVAEILPQIS